MRKISVYLTAVILLAAVCAYAKTAPAKKQPGCAGKCHIIKPYETTMNEPDRLAYFHKKAGIGCTDCHERDAAAIKSEQQKYKNKQYSDPIERREYDAAFCLKCHGSYKDVAERTSGLTEKWGRNPHESHIGEVDCSQCHRVHKPSVFICAECHKSDWENKLPVGWTTPQQ